MSDSGPVQEVRFCRAPDGVRIAYAVARLRPAAAGLDLLAQPPPVRLGEPGLAALPAPTSGGSPRSSATTSAATASPTGTSTTTGSRPGSPTSRRSPTTPGLDRFALMAHGAGRPAGHRVRRPAPRAGDPADLLRQLRRRAARPDAGGAESSTAFDAADQGRLGPAGLGVPSGVHLDDDPGRHRGADALARRAAAGRGLGRDRRRAPGGSAPQANCVDLLPGLDRADPRAALPRRPDERLRARPAASPRASPAPGWCRWRATTTSCSATSRPGRSSCDEVRGVPGRRTAPPARPTGRAVPARARGPGPGRRRPLATTRSRPRCEA